MKSQLHAKLVMFRCHHLSGQNENVICRCFYQLLSIFLNSVLFYYSAPFCLRSRRRYLCNILTRFQLHASSNIIIVTLNPNIYKTTGLSAVHSSVCVWPFLFSRSRLAAASNLVVLPSVWKGFIGRKGHCCTGSELDIYGTSQPQARRRIQHFLKQQTPSITINHPLLLAGKGTTCLSCWNTQLHGRSNGDYST